MCSSNYFLRCPFPRVLISAPRFMTSVFSQKLGGFWRFAHLFILLCVKIVFLPNTITVFYQMKGSSFGDVVSDVSPAGRNGHLGVDFKFS